jgi:adenine specific DNA methylase Mod
LPSALLIVKFEKPFAQKTFINTGEPTSNNNQSLFKFELGWLLREGFMDLVIDIWHSVDEGHNSLERW